MSDSLTEALRWITNLLRKAGIQHQFVGGLAARAYGATRALNDIDLYVPDTELDSVARDAAGFLVQDPERHIDGHWDLTFLKLSYHGWSIEVGGADTAKFWDELLGEWRPAEIDFTASTVRHMEGIPIPVTPLAQLVDYKRGLGRPVDLQDVAELRSLVAAQRDRDVPDRPAR